MNVIFVTGNPEKAAHFSKHMGQEIPHHPAELDEIQTLDAHELVEHKARQAYAQLGQPVLVEDVTFSFDALDGKLPGPFIKFFITAEAGDEKICRLLDGFDDRRAVARCTYAYFDGMRLELFDGELGGLIVASPRGTNGYGFDRVFAPDGFENKTAAELNDEGYDTYYSSIKPFDKVREFLASL